MNREVSRSEFGIWHPEHRISPKDVRDGLSKTYLLGEKIMDTETYVAGNDIGDLQPYLGWSVAGTRLSASSYVRWSSDSPFRDRPGNCNGCHDCGSSHPAGWNAAMADGSVQSLSYGLDRAVHQAHGTVAGGETVLGSEL